MDGKSLRDFFVFDSVKGVFVSVYLFFVLLRVSGFVGGCCVGYPRDSFMVLFDSLVFAPLFVSRLVLESPPLLLPREVSLPLAYLMLFLYPILLVSFIRWFMEKKAGKKK